MSHAAAGAVKGQAGDNSEVDVRGRNKRTVGFRLENAVHSRHEIGHRANHAQVERVSLGAAGQDQRFARGQRLMQQQSGVDLMHRAGKGKNGARRLVFLQRKHMAADGL